MKIIQAGHVYELDTIDGNASENQKLTFVMREGDNFPFNADSHSGTNVQEVLRVLIDRTNYMLRQKPCAETEAALHALEAALFFYEIRAARLHERHLDLYSVHELICRNPCKTCGHIGCEQHKP